MSNMKEYFLTLVICILGLFFDYMALNITLSPLIIGTTYYLWLFIQSALALFLIGVALKTLQGIWEEWRWQPAQLR